MRSIDQALAQARHRISIVFQRITRLPHAFDRDSPEFSFVLSIPLLWPFCPVINETLLRGTERHRPILKRTHQFVSLPSNSASVIIIRLPALVYVFVHADLRPFSCLSSSPCVKRFFRKSWLDASVRRESSDFLSFFLLSIVTLVLCLQQKFKRFFHFLFDEITHNSTARVYRYSSLENTPSILLFHT